MVSWRTPDEETASLLMPASTHLPVSNMAEMDGFLAQLQTAAASKALLGCISRLPLRLEGSLQQPESLGADVLGGLSLRSAPPLHPPISAPTWEPPRKGPSSVTGSAIHSDGQCQRREESQMEAELIRWGPQCGSPPGPACTAGETGTKVVSPSDVLAREVTQRGRDHVSGACQSFRAAIFQQTGGSSGRGRSRAHSSPRTTKKTTGKKARRSRGAARAGARHAPGAGTGTCRSGVGASATVIPAVAGQLDAAFERSEGELSSSDNDGVPE